MSVEKREKVKFNADEIGITHNKFQEKTYAINGKSIIQNKFL